MLGRTACAVIGGRDESGKSIGRGRDKSILLLARAVQRRLLGKRGVQTTLVSAVIDGATQQAQGDIEKRIRQGRDLGAGVEDDLFVRDTRDIAEAMEQANNTLGTLLGPIGLMLVSVTETTAILTSGQHW